MEDKYKAFLEFDWTDERWHQYLGDLYPTPVQRQILKFKKKWYRKVIDPDFDVDFGPAEPAPAPQSSGTTSGWQSSSGGAGVPSSSSASTPNGHSSTPGNLYGGVDPNWAAMGSKAVVCCLSYLLALVVAAAAIPGIANPKYALMALAFSCLQEVLLKHGIKFNKEHLQTLLQEDTALVPLMCIGMAAPQTKDAVVLVSLGPPILTALLSLGQISTSCASVPGVAKKVFSPLAEINIRYQIMQLRADLEVALGFVLIVGAFTALVSPMAPIMFWNVVTMRYMTSPWTQATFRKVDNILSMTIGRIPLVSTVYTKLKDLLYSFVDPAARQAGRSSKCTVL